MAHETGARVLITGVCGFTGHYLQKLLTEHGFEVHGTAQIHEPQDERVYHANLLDFEALRAVVRKVRPEYVVHLAAVSFVAHEDPAEIYATNIVGTRNLLRCLADEGPRRSVLLMSSANIYGNPDREPITEDLVVQPTNDYGVSKCAMEQMAQLWTPQLPITIVRPFNYTGVGQSNQFLIPKIVDVFRRRSPEIELGNIDVERDFSDVRDVVETYRRLLDVAPSGVFNVCSGEVFSLREVLRMAEEITGHVPIVRVNPAFVRTNDVKRLRGSADKLRATIGEWPRHGMRETLRWMLTSE